MASKTVLTLHSFWSYFSDNRRHIESDKEVSDQVQQMLDNGIIRPSSSPWNGPVILVKKKDDSMHFVCDFRELNDVTKKDSYPLPHIRDVIDKMEGAKFWTTLHAASAYWSMPVKGTGGTGAAGAAAPVALVVGGAARGQLVPFSKKPFLRTSLHMKLLSHRPFSIWRKRRRRVLLILTALTTVRNLEESPLLR